jgi:alpha-methylacyl-CoA racemase
MSIEVAPLSGVSVIELAGIGPAPFAGMHLRQLGARVIRVEKPGGLDSIIPADRDPLNAGKESVVLDLKDDAGRRRLLLLVSECDVLIDCYRPGVLEKLGLGPDVLLQRNPKLVVGRVTGWGQDGPLARTAGHDLNYIAITGALHAIGDQNGPPQIPLNLLGDYAGGSLYLMVGILAALLEVRRVGVGRVVDAAIVDGVAHLLSAIHGAMALGMWTDERGSNFMDGGSPFYSVYETADGKHMTVSAVEARFYAIFIRLLGIDEDAAAQHDRAHWPALRRKIAAAFRSRSQAEWNVVFAGTDACVAPVLGLKQAVDHPHMAARGALFDSGGNPQAAPAPRFLSKVKVAEASI